KAFGVFRHRNNAPASPYLAGFSDDFAIPVSRWTEVRSADIPPDSELELLIESDRTGPCLLSERTGNRLYMFNHIEYDSTSLKEEYDRDVAAGTPVEVPHGYYPDDDPSNPPLNRWRSHAHLLFGNWINQVYQTTPYEIERIGQVRQPAPACFHRNIAPFRAQPSGAYVRCLSGSAGRHAVPHDDQPVGLPVPLHMTAKSRCALRRENRDEDPPRGALRHWIALEEALQGFHGYDAGK